MISPGAGVVARLGGNPSPDWEVPVVRFLARNPGVEAGEVSERARRVVPDMERDNIREFVAL
jgi:hypothetical protein